jgi:hypothetical protein
LKKFLSIYFASLAVCTVAIVGCDRVANHRVDLITGVIVDSDGNVSYGHAPFKTIAECRDSAAQAKPSADKAGVKLGCASVELQ